MTTAQHPEWTQAQNTIREAVMRYMSHRGEDRWRLSDTQWCRLYLMADGFGQIDRQFADEQCYDWSHVRDSSPAAIGRIWAQICLWHNACKLRTAADVERLPEWVRWAKRL